MTRLADDCVGGLAPNSAVAPWLQELSWYVIQARCRAEDHVQVALERKGLEVFFPKMTLPRMRHGRKVLVHQPLFPSYLFVHTQMDAKVFHQIIKVHGVMHFLGNGAPAPVPAEEIESIRIIVTSDKDYFPWRYLERGKRVRVIDGPLAGVVGILVARKEKKRRLVVAVELFQRSVTVELDAEAVERWS